MAPFSRTVRLGGDDSATMEELLGSEFHDLVVHLESDIACLNCVDSVEK